MASPITEYAGRVAVVTGGASGIGRGIVEELLKEGARVVVADIEKGAIDATVEALSGTGEVSGVPTDVSRAASVEALAETVFDRYGACHLLFNNAGIGAPGANVWDTTPNDWTWTFTVNVFGIAYGIQSFVPRMLASGEPGHIVNTASIAALSGDGIYGVSKSAILNITETLRRDLEGTPISATALCPGMLNTKIVAAQRNRPATMGEKAREPFGSEPVTFGLDPAHCGRRVREAILADELYAFAGIPKGNEDGLKNGLVPRAEALRDAVDRGVVDEVPL